MKIGFECHVQMNKLRSKLFCSCSTDYHNSEPNTHVCPVCLGLPGALPKVNESAIESGIMAASALNCDIADEILFYRKNYFYPDLPRGFQISQYDFPLATDGYVELGGKKIGIRRIHLEEDPGRLIHMDKYSLVDYNRSGIALLEIVTEPDIFSPREGRMFLNKIRTIFEYLDIFDGGLEGSMRVDTNISLSGRRVEVKNISSYKGVERALNFEITRQRNLIRMGKDVIQETRHWDEERGITVSLRTKEEESDYRYFPEPDLVPIRGIAKKFKVTIPELPGAKKERFIRHYGISEYHARVLTSDLRLAEFYEEVASKINPVLSATWIADVLKGELNYRDLEIDSIQPNHMIDILRFLEDGEITDRIAVDIIRTLLDKGGSPAEILEDKGLVKAEKSEIEGVVVSVLNEFTKAVEDYKGGKDEALNFLVGQVMRKTRGRADPKQTREIMREFLS